MGIWTLNESRFEGGTFQLVLTRQTPGGRVTDVTTFRGAPTQLTSYSDADPFGDSTATFTFPSITPFDDFTAPDLAPWLCHYADVDLYWVPSVALAAQYAAMPKAISAITNERDVVTPTVLLDGGGSYVGDNRIKVWEGFVASLDFTGDGTSASLDISCQGALFQLDRYLQKPFYPAQPWPLELLINDSFNKSKKPNLRTGALVTQFPVGWKLVNPPYTTQTIYTPVGMPGANWSGYTSRQTGSWDHALTGFVQDQLSVMITDTRSGVTEGNQWTIAHQHQAANQRGRTPILQVRDRFRAPDFTVRYGTPGVVIRLSSDSTQSENIIYGDGTSVDGTSWRGAVISADGSRTDYLPLAADADVYPVTTVYNKPIDWLQNLAPTGGGQMVPIGYTTKVPSAFVSEAYTKFGTGFDQSDAMLSAAQTLRRDRNPGWSGTITLSVDPSEMLPRWLIRSGMTVLLTSFAGSNDVGLPLHISATAKNPMDGTVELTVDSRYRDLLTVEEAQARTRDPLTPVKMLQVNRTSVVIEDIQAPWDYSAGSGYIPKASTAFYASLPSVQFYPYVDWSERYPPLVYPAYYVKCNANSPTSRGRWAGPIPILTSEKDTISRSEFRCLDIFGRPLKLPFHVSIYDVNVTVDGMPHDGTDYSAWRNNAFTSVDPATGNPYPVGTSNAPPATMRIAWGGRIDGVFDRAGYSPSRETAGANPSGLLVDDGTWNYDNTSTHSNYAPTLLPGQKEPDSAITLYAMFYCEFTSPVYFQGRLYRQNLGTN